MTRPDSPTPIEKMLPSLAEAGGLPPLRTQDTVKTDNDESIPVATAAENVPSHAFRCPSCGVVLRRTSDATTGPCPSCLTWIEVPALRGNALPFQVVHQGGQESRVAKMDTKRLNRTGVTKFEKLKRLPKNHAEPEFEKPDEEESAADEDAKAESPEPVAASAALPRKPVENIKKRFHKQLWNWKVLGGLAVVVVLCCVVGILAYSGYKRRRFHQQQQVSRPVEISRLREQAGASAELTMEGLLNAPDAGSMAQWVIGGEAKVPDISAYLKSRGSLPHYTDTDLLSPAPMGEKDARKGICAMVYQPLGSIGLMPDVPLLAMETGAGVAAPGFLEQAAMAASMERGRLRQGLAVFLKTKDRMLLDWDTFIQTWDRTLAAFRDGKAGEGPARLRVILSLERPVPENGESIDKEIIRIQDPLNAEDVIRMEAYEHDPVVNLLRPKAEETGGPRTATVELTRNPETGRVSLSRFICWEFLGVGGAEGNAGEVAMEPELRKTTRPSP